jgi:hypothetical protein
MIRETTKIITNRLANAISFSKSGKLMGVCTPDHFIYVFDEFGKTILKKQESLEIRDLIFLDNEVELIYIIGNKSVAICNLDGDEIFDFKIDISCLGISSDGKIISCGSNLSPDKNLIYIIDREASSGLFSRKKGKIVFKDKIHHQCLVTSVSKDGSKIAFGLSNSELIISNTNGQVLFTKKFKGTISNISFIYVNDNILVSLAEGFLICFSTDFKEIWQQEFKKRNQFIAKINQKGTIIIASTKENEITLLDLDGESFWRTKLKQNAPRISINADGTVFGFALSGDKSIRRYVNESLGRESLIPLYIQKIVENEDAKFFVRMLNRCGPNIYDHLIKAMKEEKFDQLQLELLAPILDNQFFKMLLHTFLEDYNNLSIVKAIDILNNFYDDLPKMLFDSISDDYNLYKKMLEKISNYAFQRESPSMYRLLGILYFKIGDYSFSIKYLIESLIFEEPKTNMFELLTQAQQNYMKEATLSKFKTDIHIPFSPLFFK